ncbi:MAG: zinc ribbon domain-containing protein [Gammaproteobacteria bacterium]|nr:zinc ribbon domain-containing protein [Gammaproteobacteria bacterium]
MPFYEYQCNECDHHIEVLQKISAEPLVCCPECNEPALKRLISLAAFRLKGTGWYETDFKNNGEKKEGTVKDKPKDENPSRSDKTDKSATVQSKQSCGTSNASSNASPAP